MKTRRVDLRELWAGLSLGERRLITGMLRMLRGAKHSQVREVARAAAKWESGITCFIKVRLLHERPRRLLADSGWVKVQGNGAENLKRRE